MNNYKIKVNNEAESKEAQELFFELGYGWNTGLGVKHLDGKFLYAINGIITVGFSSDNFDDSVIKELTTHQLRDLVVLHRNDVRDATHTNEGEKLGFLCSDGTEYFWDYANKKWFKPEYMTFENKNMKLIGKKQEQGLISGADAKLAWANGQDVEISVERTIVFSVLNGDFKLDVFDNPKNMFRLKPRTITLSLEIPAPFEPKEGDLFWHISPEYMSGYGESMYNDGNVDTWQQFGAWRTEEEIKQVVAAMRGIKG